MVPYDQPRSGIPRTRSLPSFDAPPTTEKYLHGPFSALQTEISDILFVSALDSPEANHEITNNGSPLAFNHLSSKRIIYIMSWRDGVRIRVSSIISM